MQLKHIGFATKTNRNHPNVTIPFRKMSKEVDNIVRKLAFFFLKKVVIFPNIIKVHKWSVCVVYIYLSLAKVISEDQYTC